MSNDALHREKLAQAASLLRDLHFDAWLIFVRETSAGGDPCLQFLCDSSLTWQSALIVSRDGATRAVVGTYDADPLAVSENWDEVVRYDHSIRDALVATLDAVCGDQPRIAVNYSMNDDKADGLTHGMYLLLQSYLKGTRLEGRLESSEPMLMRLRGEKTSEELRRIVAAIERTDEIFSKVPTVAKIGASEREVYSHIQRWIDENGMDYAWDRRGDPIVNSGPDSMVGHGIPSANVRISPGHVFHIDLGVKHGGYCSDLQRIWYVSGGEGVPSDVRSAFEAVHETITVAASALRPGVRGVEVDAAAREQIQRRGYPQYMHAVGHQVGTMAHDGGAILGPAWERYGDTPFIEVRPNEVYTLELGVDVPGRGYLGLEEMVRVTEDGCQFLSSRQDEVHVLV